MVFKAMDLRMSSGEKMWMKTKHRVLRPAEMYLLTAVEEPAKEAEERPGTQRKTRGAVMTAH